MLDTCPSPGRNRPPHARLRSGPAIMATVAGAALAACALPPDRDAGATRAVTAGPPEAMPGPEGPGAGGGHAGMRPRFGHRLDTTCVVGPWVTEPRACACPDPDSDGFTAECEAADCREVDLLLMVPPDRALRATVRFSAEELRLSAAGGEPFKGTWKYHDDGELRLQFGRNVVYTPTECGALELQPKAHPPLHRPPAALDEALFRAWFFDDWTDVPYLP